MARPKSIKSAKVIHINTALRDISYRWNDRDPDLEFICNAITDSGLTYAAISESVSKSTGGAYAVSTSTIHNWMNGKVKRPQNYTLHWVAFALGYERKWEKFRP